MNRMIFFMGMSIGGYIGWWAGDYFGFDLMGAFLISSAGSAAGLFVAWRIIWDYLD